MCPMCKHGEASARGFREACIQCEIEVCGSCVMKLKSVTRLRKLWFCGKSCRHTYEVIISLREPTDGLQICPWCWEIESPPNCHCGGAGSVSFEYLHLYRLYRPSGTVFGWRQRPGVLAGFTR